MPVRWAMYLPMLCKFCTTNDLALSLINCSKLPLTTLEPLITSLLSQLPEDESSTIVSVKTEVTSSVPTNGSRSDSPVYQPSVVYVLELCTVITIRDEDTIEKFGGDVADALQNVIRYSAFHHQTTVARVVLYLFTLLQLSYVSHNSHSDNIDTKLTQLHRITLS